MKQVIDFLSDLDLHNDKLWFDAHKEEYQKAKNTFDTFSSELIKSMKELDSSLGNLTLKDCTYRIYRDLRFTKDKSPYKTHMGVFLAPGGKKSGMSGYYFHVSGKTLDEGDYGSKHIVAIGDYMMDPRVLKIIREDISMGQVDFDDLLSKADPRLKLDYSDALKNVPKGYDKNAKGADYLRLKKFCLMMTLDKKMVLKKDFRKELVKIFISAKPFLDYLNKVIEYAKEDNKEYSIDF